MARVIRAHQSLSAVVPAALQDAREQAQAVLVAARAEAERLRAGALEAGREQGRAEVARALIELAAARGSALREAERSAAEAALQVANHLLGEALLERPERIAGVVAPLLAKLRHASAARLRVSPEDAPALTQALPSVIARLSLEGSLEVVPDSGVSRGGCIVESDVGDLDARVETRLSALSRALGGLQP